MIPAPLPATNRNGDSLIDDLEEQLRMHSATRVTTPALTRAEPSRAVQAERYTHTAARGVAWAPSPKAKALAPARSDTRLWVDDAGDYDLQEEPARRHGIGWGVGMFARTAAVVLVAGGVAYAALLVLPHSSQPVADAAAVAELPGGTAPTGVVAAAAAGAPAYGEMWLRTGTAAQQGRVTAVDPAPPVTAAAAPPTTPVTTTVVTPPTQTAALQADAGAAVPPGGPLVAPAAGAPAPISEQPVTDPGIAPDAFLAAEKPMDGVDPAVGPLTPVAPPATQQVAAIEPAPAPAAAAAVAPRIVTPPARPVVAAVAPTPAPAPTAVPDAGGKRLIATANSFVNMRSGPRSNASVVTVVADGAQVEVISCNFWCEVSVGGQQGWVYQDYLDGPITRRSR